MNDKAIAATNKKALPEAKSFLMKILTGLVFLLLWKLKT